MLCMSVLMRQLSFCARHHIALPSETHLVVQVCILFGRACAKVHYPAAVCNMAAALAVPHAQRHHAAGG